MPQQLDILRSYKTHLLHEFHVNGEVSALDFVNNHTLQAQFSELMREPPEVSI
jgi:hypothetical protein